MKKKTLSTCRLVEVAPLSGFEAMDAEMLVVVVDHETLPIGQRNKTYLESNSFMSVRSELTVVIGVAFLGPPGLGGDNFGSNAPDSHSLLTGGGTGVPTVAIDTSPNQFIRTKIMILSFGTSDGKIDSNSITYR